MLLSGKSPIILDIWLFKIGGPFQITWRRLHGLTFDRRPRHRFSEVADDPSGAAPLMNDRGTRGPSLDFPPESMDFL